MDIINPDKSCQPLPTGTPVIDVFDKLGEGGTLLILGEPGSGKTITLLQLARDLIARAEAEIDRRIPVVLNLSSWATEKQAIAKWIVEELSSKYDVPRKIGQQWVEKQELLLLLDGLDEIRDLEKRNACVTALNAFQQEQATEMVVCCRMKDYEELGDRLKLQSALALQPLTTEQIQAYLDSLQSNLIVLKTLLIEDESLQELSQSPLLLNIMVFAYQGIEVADIPVSTIASNCKKQLFDDYVDRIFQGSRLRAYHPSYKSQENYHYSRQDATRWLVWIAKHIIWYSQTIFLIEKTQPYWLNKEKIIFYQIGTLLTGSLMFGLSIGITFGLLSGLNTGINLGLSFGFIGGLIVAITGGLILQINSVESVRFSWEKCKKEFKRALNFGLIAGFLIALPAGISIAIPSGIFLGLVSMLSIWLVSGLIIGISLGLIGSLIVGLTRSEVKLKTYPNQGIQQSANNAMTLGLISFLIFGLIFGILTGVNTFFARNNGEFIIGINEILISGLRGSVTFGLMFGLFFWLFFGGLTCIKHFVLRLILYVTGRIPCNYAKFLDWASDKLFLQKVGGGYIFIHRSLMEHFAEMENG